MQAPWESSAFAAHLEGGFGGELGLRPAPKTAGADAGGSSASDFARWLLELINGGALAVMISVGHRAGLFDALARRPDVSLDELVAHTGLDAHELRAWLDAMIVGGLIEQHAELGTYALPDAHAASLCQSTGPDNLAVLAQYVGLLGRAEDELLAKLRGPAACQGGTSESRARTVASGTRKSSGISPRSLARSRRA